jgi:prepilin-type N-terminal cleavage/methylation domain-containing protein
MKKKLRRNNKGFSLVELIVVVLIMAIIAVALAPQVMKWVGSSRTNTDVQIYDSLVSDIQVALTKESVWSKCKVKTGASAIKITLTKSADAEIENDPENALANELNNVAGSNWKSNARLNADQTAVIKVDKGSVIRDTEPAKDSNS